MKIFLSSGLTHVPRFLFQEYVQFQHQIALRLREHFPGTEVSYALVNGDPERAAHPDSAKPKRCYIWNRRMVEEAGLVIAEASFASTGQGIELQIAENNNIPIIILFRDFEVNRASHVSYKSLDDLTYNLQIGSGFVSLMALGLPNVLGVIQYKSTDDGLEQITEAVGEAIRVSG